MAMDMTVVLKLWTTSAQAPTKQACTSVTCTIVLVCPSARSWFLPGMFFRKFPLSLHMKHQVTTFDVFNDQEQPEVQRGGLEPRSIQGTGALLGKLPSCHAILTDFVSGNRSGGRPGKGWQTPAQTRVSPSEPSQCPGEEPEKKSHPGSSDQTHHVLNQRLFLKVLIRSFKSMLERWG